MLTDSQLREILDHVEHAVPNEACGLLAGQNERVEKIFPVRNQAESPVRFVMDPYEQLKALQWMDDNHLDLLGIFHSHPTGPETASPVDIAEAAYEVIHVILSRNKIGWKARAFWFENDGSHEVPLEIVE
ncbi:MAG: M67 family metallopeptidase [Chloroflexota bacterium]